MAIDLLPAGVIQFNGDVPPQQAGWTPLLHGSPEIEINSGVLTQIFDAPGDQAFYNRSIGEFAGAPTFFAEWRMQTDAPASLLDTFQIPTGFVLSGNGIFYHFVFSDTEALFLRFDLSFDRYPIEPGIMHTYRIELFGEDLYRFLVDGSLVDSGVPDGPYPTIASEIIWGGEFDVPGHTDHWDYVTYGAIPEPATGLLLLAGLSSLILRRKANPSRHRSLI